MRTHSPIQNALNTPPATPVGRTSVRAELQLRQTQPHTNPRHPLHRPGHRQLLTPKRLLRSTPAPIDLQWTAPTDQGTGVKTYLLYKNGTYVTTTSNTTYSFGGLTANPNYTLGVVAQDAHFNVSTSATVNIDTSAFNRNIPIAPTRLGILNLMINQ